MKIISIPVPLKARIYIMIQRLRKIKTYMSHLILGKKAPLRDETILIEPGNIKGHLELKKNGWQKLSWKTGYKSSAVAGGDWDKEYITYLNIKNEEVFKSCYDHWINGVPWEDTPLYDEYVQKLKSGIPNRFSSIQELSDRYRRLDRIYDTVKRKQKLSDKPDDLIRISIARDGKLIWGPDGRHRICLAICAGLNKIPAKVGFVHSDAVDYFQELRTN